MLQEPKIHSRWKISRLVACILQSPPEASEEVGFLETKKMIFVGGLLGLTFFFAFWDASRDNPLLRCLLPHKCVRTCVCTYAHTHTRTCTHV